MKLVFTLLLFVLINCIQIGKEPPGYGTVRDGCYKGYANDRKFGLCSKEDIALQTILKQDLNTEFGQKYANDPIFHDLSYLYFCQELVQKRKKECDSQHVDLNP